MTLGVIGLIAALCSFALVLFYTRRKRKVAEGNRFSQLKLRLRLFSEMKGEENKEDDGSANVIGIFTGNEHKILLGVLKKIEAKNSVVLAATALVLAISIRLLAQEPLTACRLGDYLLAIAIGLVGGTVVARVDGAAHVDQKDFEKINVKKDLCEKCQIRKLQWKLAEDLIQKEARFRISFWILGVAFLVMLLPLLFSSPIVCSSAKNQVESLLVNPNEPHWLIPLLETSKSASATNATN